jgi:hypothetical protein
MSKKNKPSSLGSEVNFSALREIYCDTNWILAMNPAWCICCIFSWPLDGTATSGDSCSAEYHLLESSIMVNSLLMTTSERSAIDDDSDSRGGLLDSGEWDQISSGMFRLLSSRWCCSNSASDLFLTALPLFLNLIKKMKHYLLQFFINFVYYSPSTKSFQFIQAVLQIFDGLPRVEFCVV